MKRRRNNYKVESYISSNDNRRMAVLSYMIQACKLDIPLDESFMDCISFALNGLQDFTQNISALLKAREKNTQTTNIDLIADKKQKSVRNIIPFSALSAKESKEVQKEISNSLPRDYAEMWDDLIREYPKFQAPFLNLLCSFLEGKGKQVQITENKNLTLLSKEFQFNSDTIKFIEFVYHLQSIKEVENYFEDTLNVHQLNNQGLLARLLNMTTKNLEQAIKEAMLTGALKSDFGYYLKLNDNILNFLQTDSEEELDKLFYGKIKTAPLPLKKFTLEEDSINHAINLLSHKGKEPVHILLYGAPGTGKTCFSSSAAKHLGKDAWIVPSGENDGDGTRRSSLVACRHLLLKKKNAILVVDEAENLLDTGSSPFGSKSDKAWLNSFLELEHSRIIWITNKIYHLDDAVRRRFNYSIHFEELDKAQRKDMWLQAIKSERVSRYFSEEVVEKFAKDYDVPVAMIVKAIHESKMLKHKEDTFINSVENILNSYVTLLNDGEKKEKKESKDNKDNKESCTEYNLDGVSLEKGAHNSIHDFMARVNKLDAYLTTHETIPPNSGTMLFYGPPGSGKTALAKHIGKELNRKVHIKRASDIFGSFVGESEKNIRKAFKKAEAENAILLFDEADSFIFSRESAMVSWETSGVNEFLTSLESFKGICICSTNRRENMDSAAMRRFAFKLGFDYAGANQLLSLYTAILQPLMGSKGEQGQVTITEGEQKLLTSFKHLTGGDFAAVRAQFWLHEAHEITHKDLLAALDKEQKLKLEAVSKKIGF